MSFLDTDLESVKDDQVPESHPAIISSSTSSKEIRQIRIQQLCKSKLLESWQTEYTNVYCNESENSIGNIFQEKFPRFSRCIDLFFSVYVTRCCIFLQVWNILVFALWSDFSCSFDVLSLVLNSVEWFLPFILLLIVWAILCVWNGVVSEEGERRGTIKHRSTSFKQHMNNMMHYLTAVKESNIELFERDSYLDLIFIAVYAVPFLTFFSALLSIPGDRLSDDDCSSWFGPAHLYHFPCMMTMYLAGVMIYLGLKIVYMTSWVSHNMILTWINRYFPIMRLGIDELEKYMPAEVKEAGMTSREFAKRLRRDSYERYFMINHFVMESSSAWEKALAFFVLFAIIMSVFFIYGFSLLLSDPSLAAIFLILAMSAVSSMLFILAQITYANKAMMEIYELVIDRVPSSSLYEKYKSQSDDAPLMDFEILGGKTELLAVVSDTPIFWTVYGFAITPLILKNLLVTTITSAITALISYCMTTYA